MNNDAARRHEDEQTRARHDEAVAAGERRLLARTMNGGGIAGLVYAAGAGRRPGAKDPPGAGPSGSQPAAIGLSGDVTDCAHGPAKSKLGQ